MITVLPDAAAVSAAAAERFVVAAGAAIAERGEFLVALAGGSTPRLMYEHLARSPIRDQIDWPRVRFFWGDERCVPPDDARSNYRMAREALLDRIPAIRAAQIHRIRGELSPRDAADDYEALLRRRAAAPPLVFDLVLLGLGADGHTASLFPGQPVPADRWAAAVPRAPDGLARITLTPPILNESLLVAFLVVGVEKAAALRRVLDGHESPPLPAQFIQPRRGELHWFSDRAAAAELEHV